MKLVTWLCFAPVLMGISCSNHAKEADLDVNVFHLKSRVRLPTQSNVVRAEQQKRLHGAVSLVEQRERLGLYYTVSWKLRKPLPVEPLRVVFRYQQAATASKMLSLEKRVVAVKTRGKCEFVIKGDDYQRGGRVLDWRVELFSGEKLLASEQSYLWQ